MRRPLDGAVGLHGDGSLVGSAVLVSELSLAIRPDELQIVIRVGHLLIGCSISNLQVQNFLCRLVEQVVGVPRSSSETGTHAWGQSHSTLIRVQRGMAGDDVDEFVLLCVRVA